MGHKPSLTLRATDAQITEWGIVFADGLPLELVGSLSCALPKAVIDAGLGHVFGGVVAAFSAESQQEWRAQVENLLLERYPDPVDRWIKGLHTGRSSCALYAVLIARSDEEALTAVQRVMSAHHPHDGADYQRCLDMVRYAEALSEAWHARQETIRAHAPEAWRPWLVRLADEMRAEAALEAWEDRQAFAGGELPETPGERAARLAAAGLISMDSDDSEEWDDLEGV